MPIKDELLDELLKEYKNPEDLIGKDGILKQLTKRLVEKAMENVDQEEAEKLALQMQKGVFDFNAMARNLNFH